MPIDPQLISHGEFHVEEGIDRGPRAARARRTGRPRSSPATTSRRSGVYQAAREARLHIPEDLSVVGFDDLPVAQWVGPPLTTVRQPLVEMAVAAAELVLGDGQRRAAGPDAPRAGDRAGRPREHRAAPGLIGSSRAPRVARRCSPAVRSHGGGAIAACDSRLAPSGPRGVQLDDPSLPAINRARRRPSRGRSSTKAFAASDDFRGRAGAASRRPDGHPRRGAATRIHAA